MITTHIHTNNETKITGKVYYHGIKNAFATIDIMIGHSLAQIYSEPGKIKEFLAAVQVAINDIEQQIKGGNK